MIALWCALALAAPAVAEPEPDAEPVLAALPDWSIPVRAPEIPRIWVPVAETDSTQPAEAGDPGGLPSVVDGRELPSPWARRGRHMNADGTIVAGVPTRIDPATGEVLVRQRPALGTRVALVSLGGLAVFAASAGIVAGAASGL